MSLEGDVLARITPGPESERTMEGVAARLVAGADARLRDLGVPGRATVQGSLAKGTWLKGGGDIDLFLLLDPGVPQARLEQVTRDVGKSLLDSPRTRYAQHPYLVGEFEGHTVDLVPAYRVASAAARMSAVDRTPFHTTWVKDHLDAAGRAEVRLAKAWLKGIGCYGAQTALGGFSGYLVEVLVVHLGSFADLLAWLRGGGRPRRIALGQDLVEDDVSPLVVVDPVDPARNCAAAVQATTLELAEAAAEAYARQPDLRFFFPAPPRPAPPGELGSALARQGLAWAGILLEPRTDRLDIVLPQFQKATRTWAAALEDAGFPVARTSLLASADSAPRPPADQPVTLLAQFATTMRQLPPTRMHAGPADDGRPHAERFREKWAGHTDAAGPVTAGPDGRLAVEVRVAHRTAPDFLAARLAGIPVGRHVAQALPDARVLRSPGQAPGEWQATVADFVLGLPSWAR